MIYLDIIYRNTMKNLSIIRVIIYCEPAKMLTNRFLHGNIAEIYEK